MKLLGNEVETNIGRTLYEQIFSKIFSMDTFIPQQQHLNSH